MSDDKFPLATRCDVSVIIPAYNAQAYVETAIRSVLAQLCQPNEIIVVNDASTDRTAEIVARLAREDARIRLVSLPVNGGPSAGRNHGISVARSAWVTFLDADDTYAPQRLQALWALACHSSCDVVTDNLDVVGDDGSSGPMFPMGNGEATELTLLKFLKGCFYERKTTSRRSFGFLKVMIRRDFVEQHRLRYEERLRIGEDLVFYIRCLLAGARWVHTARPLYRYRVRSGSLVETWSPDASRKIAQCLHVCLQDDVLRTNADARRALKQLRDLAKRDEIYGRFREAILAGSGRDVGRILAADPAASYVLAKEMVMRSPRILGSMLGRLNS